MKREQHKNRSSRGYALLEYCAGAAVIAGVVWGAVTFLGSGMDEFLRSLGDWAKARATDVRSGTSGAGEDQAGR